MKQRSLLARLITAAIFFFAAIFGAIQGLFLVAFLASVFLGILVYDLMDFTVQQSRQLPHITATGPLCMHFNGEAFPEWLEVGACHRYYLTGIAPEYVCESLVEREDIIYNGVRYHPA